MFFPTAFASFIFSIQLHRSVTQLVKHFRDKSNADGRRQNGTIKPLVEPHCKLRYTFGELRHLY